MTNDEPPRPSPVALDGRAGAGAQQKSPSAARNREYILGVLTAVLPRGAKVLEIASGTGEHAVHFARARPDISWLPSDPDEASRASIAAWTAEKGLTNIAPPMAIDVRERRWKLDDATFDAVVAINMIHIAPLDATRGLIAGSARLLKPGGVLFLYGPFMRGGVHTAPSNAAFDASLKSRDPRWGVRDLNEVANAAASRFDLETVVEMPANNLSVVFRRLKP